MSKELRVAILGGGKMAQKHGTAIRLQPGARFVAVGDPFLTAEEIKERFGADIQAYADAATLLQEVKPDIVHIVTPPHTHYELAKQCLLAGASVYVEKPFALNRREAAEILDLAASRGLRACAAHQVLFQRAGQLYQQYLPMIGDLIHVESYFSFKPVRRRPDGGAPLSAVDQLIDILPHPVYLLLSALEHEPGAMPQLASFEVAHEGEVRAVIRSGKTLATLIVTLRGRPVESYLRVVGTNGSVTADFILGDIVKSFGPGASAPAVVFKPFSQSSQKFWGSVGGVGRLLFRRQKSYPGLGELLERLYNSVRSPSAPLPMERATIMNTVQICEEISQRLHAVDARAEEEARRSLEERTARLPRVDHSRGVVLVTGGSGFLGRPTLRELRQRGWPVRALVRRKPSARAQVPGVEYVEGDLGREVPPEALKDVSVVAHLAAETAGNQAAHERNSIVATRNLLDAMQRAGVRRLINISSVAVLKPGPSVLQEDSPVDRGNLARGPYVWAKAEAEAIAIEHAATGVVDVRTIRLGPLVDFEDFTPPGRLGRDVVRLFVGMGGPSKPLSVCDVHTAAKVIRSYAESFEAAPPMVNLVEVPPTTRGDLANRLRKSRPELKFFWMPFPVLKMLSGLAVLLQKALRPGKPALDLYAAFKSENYHPAVAQRVIAAANTAPPAPIEERSESAA
ncbi:Gfo/Idh/MocA family oxidoreductase [Steroidobacter sp. S1-65]|uniref:Gfo/Idh/MocA family oxidoreductase n=1 Tax=Steroidobacter gossypii TaxID=2805490 RepID=A0ABS1WZ36_9GAMM|nr:Gfo/Idh/MocA family oxidoreductase [Steroidobacter gossypii]MBM0106236.1 Gfo/Idh/MocA family oxidoreductase [Steroidobacter gossypii]